MAVHPIFKSPQGGYYFFGYYDKSPFDRQGSRLLAQRAPFMDRMPRVGETLKIGYFNWRSDGKFTIFAETCAWNWQQGCMLQWLGPAFDNRVIFNDVSGERFISKIVTLDTGETRTLSFPVYTVHPDGNKALCIDFERLYWYRDGYNYQGVVNIEKNIDMDPDDGIWELDIESDTLTSVVKLSDLLLFEPLTSMRDAVHYVEHAMYSPAGSRFAFLHRWRLADGGIYSRLYVADSNGENMTLVHDSGRVSHFSWRDEMSLVAFVGNEGGVNRLRQHGLLVRWMIRPLKPIYRIITLGGLILRQSAVGEGYMLIDVHGNKKSRIGRNLLNEDGHPTYSPASNQWLLTDTYPRPKHGPRLILFNTLKSEKYEMAELTSISEHDDSGTRCDLHPRWSRDGRYICVDTMDDGRRQMYVYDAEEMLAKYSA